MIHRARPRPAFWDAWKGMPQRAAKMSSLNSETMVTFWVLSGSEVDAVDPREHATGFVRQVGGLGTAS